MCWELVPSMEYAASRIQRSLFSAVPVLSGRRSKVQLVLYLGWDFSAWLRLLDPKTRPMWRVSESPWDVAPSLWYTCIFTTLSKLLATFPLTKFNQYRGPEWCSLECQYDHSPLDFIVTENRRYSWDLILDKTVDMCHSPAWKKNQAIFYSFYWYLLKKKILPD